MKFKEYYRMFQPSLSSMQNRLIGAAVILVLPFIYWIVYITGGIQYVYSHSMYFPIIIGALFLGPIFGGITGFLAGILLGPLMPIDTFSDPMIMQPVFNWIYRLIIFTSIGVVAGLASEHLKKRALIINELMSFHAETKIPNTNYLIRSKKLLKDVPHTILTVLINNYQHILDVLGTDVYHDLLNHIYRDLKQKLDPQSIIIQADTNKLWVITPYDNLEGDALRVIEFLNIARVVQNIPLYVDFSLGISRLNEADEADNLSNYEESDIAARYAQLNGLSYSLYGNDKLQKQQDYELLSSFNNALKENQTYLVYQPIIDLKSERMVGLEALIRWKHPIKGTIMPNHFIPLLEETKLIYSLTDWVMLQACRKINEFRSLGIDMPISVNISARNLYDPTFFDRTMLIIDGEKVPHHLIELELTETTLMLNPHESKMILNRFVETGIVIALDDFGTGYSSLSSIHQFPIEIIKIDRQFIFDIHSNPASFQIVKATIQIAKELGYRVVSEGVETLESLDIVKGFECDCAQGYYYAKPIISKEIINWYKEYNKFKKEDKS